MNSVPVPPDPYTMNQIAAATGGKAYSAQTASSVVQIYKSLGRISAAPASAWRSPRGSRP